MSRYQIDNVCYPSVTEILNLVSAKDGLMQWAANLAVETGNRFAWKEKRESTKDIGHELHTLIETFINIELKWNEYENKNQDAIYLKIIDDFFVYTDRQTYNLKQMFYQFYNWQKKNVKQFIKAEGQIVHDYLGFAGTYDFVWEDFQGKIHLTDTKTKNELYGEEKFQLSAYKAAYEDMNKEDYIIKNHRNGQEWTTHLKHIPLKIDKIDILKISRDFFEPIELKDFTNGQERNFSAFCGLLIWYYFSAKRRLKNNKRATLME